MALLLRLFIPFILFPATSALLFRFAPQRWKLPLFAVNNVLGMFGLCLLSPLNGLYFWQLQSCLAIVLPVLAAYVLAILLHYVLLRRFAARLTAVAWAPFLFPIAFMLVVKYAPGLSELFRRPLTDIGKTHIAEFFIGISYMAFRLSHLVLEVRNGVVPMPTFSEYVSFAFFVPTLLIGPISPYSLFRESLHKPDRKQTPIGRSTLRIVVGATKYLFLGSVVEQLSYSGLMFDSHPHPRIDLLIAAVAFYIYLYLNFSGYCDMAIGSAGLLGIRVAENFDQPFRARNLQEFWTRWHITLSTYMRDMVFSPVCKALTRRFGPASAPHVIAVGIFTVFILMGAWHGIAPNFLIHGFLQGVGVVVAHYYTVFLKRRLGKAGYTKYMANRGFRAAGVAITFAYTVFTLCFFANSLDRLRALLVIAR